MRTSTVSFEHLGDHGCFLNSAFTSFDEKPDLEYMKRIESLVRKIINNELTPFQKELITEHYYNKKTMTEIARERGINKSTVSRSLKSAREKIGKSIRYGGLHFLKDY